MKCFPIAAADGIGDGSSFHSSRFADRMKPLEWGSLECAGNESIDFDGIGVSVIEVSSLIRKDSPTIESMFLNLAERVAGQGIDDV